MCSSLCAVGDSLSLTHRCVMGHGIKPCVVLWEPDALISWVRCRTAWGLGKSPSAPSSPPFLVPGPRSPPWIHAWRVRSKKKARNSQS